jgi:light-regulated signal transduction histidine kinase (bacteriophytochrome)
MILLELFMAVTTVTGLTLGAVTAERRHAEQGLLLAHAELERRVQDRTAELAVANKELAQKNEEVEAFVYIVSHDLRAPLVNLQGFARELQVSCGDLERALSPAALPAAATQPVQQILKQDIPDSLRYIAASTSKFERLIDALLTLSRYGRQNYQAITLDVRTVVDLTLDALRQSLLDSGAKVRVGPLPKALGDATAIGQVFANLIGNALKYRHPERQPAIEIGGEVIDGMAHYWVRDNGAGIPSAARRRLFQVFQRFHPQMASGEGMGLAIVKRVVERHGGRLWADSEEGLGSTFHLTLSACVEGDLGPIGEKP